MGVVPARGVVVLEGTAPGPEGERSILVGDQGIRRIVLAAVGDGTQVTVEMDEARAVRAEALGASAVLVDLVVEGRGGEADLPSPDQLRAWVEGVSLVRQAGGPPRDRKLVVLDPGHGGFDHGADRRAGNEACTFGGRAEENFGGTVLGDSFIRNGTFDQRNLNEIAGAQANGFFDGIGDVGGFG